MIKVGKWIAKHKILIIIIGIALLIPAYLGMAATRINYDVLSYLPDTLETVEGQDIMVDQFGSRGGYGTKRCSCSERENRSSRPCKESFMV